ncbi:MAG: ABC transporter permease [Flammeovirgaceae bacterium]|nr:ABC transporter permease [Flammeovirgaceae bacterium]
MADKNFLKVFSFPLLDGNPETALNHPNNIILTESLAYKIFGQQNPIGEILKYQNKKEFKVSGIMADIPEHSHLQFSYILPAQSHFWYRNEINKVPWYNNGWYTYALGQSNALLLLILILETKAKPYWQVWADVNFSSKYF